MDHPDVQVGKSYRVIARLEETGPGFQIFGTLRSKRIKFKGVVHWHFEGLVWEHLVNPDYIDEIEEERRRVL
jgi:hypothetical protein